MDPSAKSPEEPDAPITVVYVEDDEFLARLTIQYLSAHGIEMTHIDRGDRAVAEVLRVRPDVVLLDVMLPGMNGFEICRALRQQIAVPIVMLTARAELADRVTALDDGADDYMTKPVALPELLARVRAQARRARGRVMGRPSRLVVGELTVDAVAMSASLAGAPLELTTLELALLRALAEQAGRVLTREQLLHRMHGSADEVFDRAIDVHVSRLRTKLRAHPLGAKMLKTIRGVGYVLTPPGMAPPGDEPSEG